MDAEPLDVVIVHCSQVVATHERRSLQHICSTLNKQSNFGCPDVPTEMEMSTIMVELDPEDNLISNSKFEIARSEWDSAICMQSWSN